MKYEITGKDSWTCDPAEVALSEDHQGINAKELQDQVTDEKSGLFSSVARGDI